MRRLNKYVLIVIILCAMIISMNTVSRADAASVKEGSVYTDWFFNDDYSRIYIGGKWYDNFITITREDESIYGTGEKYGNLRMSNTWNDYVTTPWLQEKYTADEYYEREKSEIGFEFGAAAFFYPAKEVIFLNWKPWQDCVFKDYYIQAMKDAGKQEYLDIIGENKIYNGLSAGIFEDKLSLDAAQARYNIDKMPVYVFSSFLIKNYQEYYELTNGETSELKRTEDKFENLVSLKEYIKNKSKATITLHINSNQMEVSNGKTKRSVLLDAAPVAPHGTTLVPIKAISDAFGAEVEWLSKTQEIIITGNTAKIRIKIGSDIADVNGEQVKMLEAAQTRNSRTVIPLKFISEKMGYKVKWDGKTSKITISNY